MEQKTAQNNVIQQNAPANPRPSPAQPAAAAAAVQAEVPVSGAEQGAAYGADGSGVRDRYDGYKVTELGDNVFVFGLIISILIGFVVWSRTADLTGFLVGIAVTAVGCFLSRGLKVILSGYAQLINNAAEQTKILKRMEQERAAQLLKEAQAEVAKAAAEAAQALAAGGDAEGGGDGVPEEVQEPEVIVIEDPVIEDDEEDKRRAAIALVEESLPDTVKAKVFDAYNPGSKRRNPFVPAQEAVESDRHNRIAVFSARYGGEVKCPICNRRQSSHDDTCQLCGCRFIFVDNNSKKTKKAGARS